LKIRAIVLISTAVALTAFATFGKSVWLPVYIKVRGKETIQSIEEKIEADSLERLWSSLMAAGFSELPDKMALVAIKADRVLEIWGKQDAEWVLIKTYPFTAFSGKLGPKLKEGDKQIPEGIYKIEYLNPNSLFYLSMKVSYPNDFDKAKVAIEGRTNPGGDIFVHGKNKTIGCIPIGDEAIEEVFLLASKTLKNEIKVVISPVDFRKTDRYPNIESVTWTEELYQSIERELKTSFSNR
jgi:murein L,D-transpeptidase YafK